MPEISFRTPSGRTIGLAAGGPVFAYDARPAPRRRIARDDAPMTASVVLQAIAEALEKLPPEEAASLLNGLRDIVEASVAAEDEPPAFETGGRPRPGGGQDPLGANRTLAGDSRPRRRATLTDFARRHPNAARITRAI